MLKYLHTQIALNHNKNYDQYLWILKFLYFNFLYQIFVHFSAVSEGQCNKHDKKQMLAENIELELQVMANLVWTIMAG